MSHIISPGVGETQENPGNDVGFPRALGAIIMVIAFACLLFGIVFFLQGWFRKFCSRLCLGRYLRLEDAAANDGVWHDVDDEFPLQILPPARPVQVLHRGGRPISRLPEHAEMHTAGPDNHQVAPFESPAAVGIQTPVMTLTPRSHNRQRNRDNREVYNAAFPDSPLYRSDSVEDGDLGSITGTPNPLQLSLLPVVVKPPLSLLELTFFEMARREANIRRQVTQGTYPITAHC